MSLSFKTKFGYGVGHILNDLCSAMWFSYLLLYFHHVLHFPNILAGALLLIGQVVDALSTPFIGYEADRKDDLEICIKYGRRKTWHLVGTLLVLFSFAFIFVGCLVCYSNTSPLAQLLYFSPFVIVFQFGWACTQISHLALLPNLSPDCHDRTELNAIRYAFTVMSTIMVYCITWLILGFSTTSQDDVLGPKDSTKFIVIVLIVLAIGATFSLTFHVLIKEDNRTIMDLIKDEAEKESNIGYPAMIWKDWLKEPQFYQVGLLYMATRLFCNLSQAYIPIYLQDTLMLDEKSIAYIPLVMYVSGLVTTFAMKPMNRLAGRKMTFIIGCALGGSGALWVFLGTGELFLRYYLYLVALLLGSGASTMLVTVLSITADMIGSNTECGAFVYGSLSFTDKLSNGLAVMLIQSLTPCLSCCVLCKEYFRKVIGYACGGAVLLGVFALVSLTTTKIGRKRFHQGLLDTASTVTRNSYLSEEGDDDHSVEDYLPVTEGGGIGGIQDYSPLTQEEGEPHVIKRRDSVTTA